MGLLVVAAALGGAEGGAPHQAAAGAATPLHVVAQRGDLRLELTIPRGSYPRDALVRVRAIVLNTSRHTFWIETPGPIAPGRYVPQVEVLNGDGLSLPISLTTYFPYPGPPPGAASIAPDGVLGGAEDIVLRGSWVRLGITVLRGPKFPLRTRFGLETRAARVRLLPPDPPTVQLSLSATYPFATIETPPGVHGLPQAVWYADCGGVDYFEQIYWTSTPIYFVPGCLPLHALHALIGWRGHSVASIDYSGG